eukprot:SAG11_NODE_1380_length_5081_cov_6.100963_2_plen_74_part_00
MTGLPTLETFAAVTVHCIHVRIVLLLWTIPTQVTFLPASETCPLRLLLFLLLILAILGFASILATTLTTTPRR